MNLTTHSCCTCPFWQHDAWTPFRAAALLTCSLLFSVDGALDNAFVVHLSVQDDAWTPFRAAAPQACSLLFTVDDALDNALVVHLSVLAR